MDGRGVDVGFLDLTYKLAGGNTGTLPRGSVGNPERGGAGHQGLLKGVRDFLCKTYCFDGIAFVIVNFIQACTW